MNLLGYIVIFSVLSGVLSLAGGVFLLLNQSWVRRFSMHFVSFAAGALLGAAFLDLLPEALDMGDKSSETVLLASLLGIAAFFFLEKLLLRFHPHHHDDDESHHHAAPWLLTIGDTLHNFMDGVAIAAGFLTSPAVGVVTALAVGAHELPQEIGDFSVMLHHGWERKKVLWVNVLVSLSSIAGAVLAYFFRVALLPVLPQILGLTAGIFIYISAADLIPEITSRNAGSDKTSHVLLLLVLGIALVWVLRRILE